MSGKGPCFISWIKTVSWWSMTEYCFLQSLLRIFDLLYVSVHLLCVMSWEANSSIQGMPKNYYLLFLNFIISFLPIMKKSLRTIKKLERTWKHVPSIEKDDNDSDRDNLTRKSLWKIPIMVIVVIFTSLLITPAAFLQWSTR